MKIEGPMRPFFLSLFFLSLCGGLILFGLSDAKAQNFPEDQDNRETGLFSQTVTVARALDKVTARITELELPEGEEVRFGSLLITARHCESRPPEEPPETFAFLEIDDVYDDNRRRIFSGWMMASSPALNALEHPVYDVWVIACKIKEPSESAGNR